MCVECDRRQATWLAPIVRGSQLRDSTGFSPASLLSGRLGERLAYRQAAAGSRHRHRQASYRLAPLRAGFVLASAVLAGKGGAQLLLLLAAALHRLLDAVGDLVAQAA